MTGSPEGLFSLEGRSAVVTGASRGLGEMIAQALALAGADVIGLGRSSTPSLSQEHAFRYEQCDVNDQARFTGICEILFGQTGRLDVLVNAAGISLPKSDSPEAEVRRFEETVRTNLVAVFECCQIASEFMKRVDGGSIVNVTSIASHQGFPENPGYVASKGGLRSLTKALALDYASDGIRVNNLVPGYFRTDMTEASFADEDSRHERDRRTVLGRWGEPFDLAGAAVYLTSDASAYVTGSDLVVDGGWVAKGL